MLNFCLTGNGFISYCQVEVILFQSNLKFVQRFETLYCSNLRHYCAKGKFYVQPLKLHSQFMRQSIVRNSLISEMLNVGDKSAP